LPSLISIFASPEPPCLNILSSWSLRSSWPDPTISLLFCISGRCPHLDFSPSDPSPPDCFSTSRSPRLITKTLLQRTFSAGTVMGFLVIVPLWGLPPHHHRAAPSGCPDDATRACHPCVQLLVHVHTCCCCCWKGGWGDLEEEDSV
jgi:hypothetical protein